jgi:PAP2 superfamily
VPEATREDLWARLRRFVADPGVPGGPRRTRLWFELLVIVWLCWVYDAINNLAPLRTGEALRNARDILHAERRLHLDPESALDHWLLHHHALALWVSDYYDNVHFAVTLTLVGILWLRFPRLYRPLRNTLVLTNVTAMVVFWVFPTAPPRLLDPAHFPDVVSVVGGFGSWHSGALATAANEFAAMPSLHIAWACWSALALHRLFAGRRGAALVWLYPGLTALAVLSTGNHFLFDVLGGAATLAVSAAIANLLEAWRVRRATMPDGDLGVEVAGALATEGAAAVNGAAVRSAALNRVGVDPAVDNRIGVSRTIDRRTADLVEGHPTGVDDASLGSDRAERGQIEASR